MLDRPSPMLIETACIPLTYCDGIAFVDVGASGNATLTFFADQRAIESSDGRIDRIIVAHLVMPKAVLAEVVAKITASGERPIPSVQLTHHTGGRA